MDTQDYKKKIKNASNFSWICTIASVFLAFLPGISSLLKYGATSSYNPELAVLTATLIGLVWYVFWTYRAAIIPTIENLERKNEYKKSLSTALLIELQWTDRHLRQIYKGETWSFDPISYPVLKEAERNLHVFSPTTISKIAVYQNRILLFQNSFKEQIEGYDEKKYSKEDIKMHMKFNKMKALLAIETLNELAKALNDEGGESPKALKSFETRTHELPVLPQSIFPDFKVRDENEIFK